MARPLRVEFAGAAHHVMSRSNARSAIVADDLAHRNARSIPAPRRRVEQAFANRRFRNDIKAIGQELTATGH
jgi:hypothetical protein